MLPVRPLGSTGVTPLPRYYGPLRLPARAVPLVMYPLGPLEVGCPSPPCRVSQVPRLIYPCALVPNHPGRSGECLLIASPPVSGFIHIGRTGHLQQRNEAESGSLALRLTGLLPRFPPAGLLRLAPVPLHARTSNLHGEFLSIHKISQA